MIRVLVVDDDNLVRKGLISFMPWNEFGMEVVGEAKSGEQALELLRERPVDLMLTDLGMPVMSGIELMRIVRERHPDVFIVVLTLHQTFEFVQEALRLGAIDYIAKVQLEQEHFGEVLGRIRDRIERETDKRAAGESGAQSEPLAADEAYALLSTEADPDPSWLREQAQAWTALFRELDAACWLRHPEAPAPDDAAVADWEATLASKRGWAALRVRGCLGVPRERLASALRAYQRNEWFYEYDADAPIVDKTLVELERETPRVTEERWHDLKKRATSLVWMHDESAYVRLLGELEEAKMPRSKLFMLLFETAAAWNRTYGPVAEATFDVPERVAGWGEIEALLREARRAVVRSAGSAYSEAIASSIRAAVKIVKDELHEPLYATEVAKRVNMSRSYFNQCFKDIVGRSFNDYVRSERVEAAKQLLLATNRPIQWIAERTGYADEKYFSRVFREQTGRSPSEFRKK